MSTDPSTSSRCCNKIRCCRQFWAGTFDLADLNEEHGRPLAYETTCEQYEIDGPLGAADQQSVHVTVTGCEEFDIDCTFAKDVEHSVSDFGFGGVMLYVSEDCEQCAMLAVSGVVLGMPNPDYPADPEAPPWITADCTNPETVITVFPIITQFRVFPVGTLGDGKCAYPYVYGANDPLEPDVWAPPMTFDDSECPANIILVDQHEWKKNPCHLILLPSRSGINFPGRIPVCLGTCDYDACLENEYNPYCVPDIGEEGFVPAHFCTDFDHYCLHVAVINGEYQTKSIHYGSMGVTVSAYDYGPAICRCAQCCPDVTFAWVPVIEEMLVVEESAVAAVASGPVFPEGATTAERRAAFAEWRQANPVRRQRTARDVQKEKFAEAKARAAEPVYARCEHLPILPAKKTCGSCWQAKSFACPKVGRLVTPKRDCGPKCRFYEEDPDAPPVTSPATRANPHTPAHPHPDPSPASPPA